MLSSSRDVERGTSFGWSFCRCWVTVHCSSRLKKKLACPSEQRIVCPCARAGIAGWNRLLQRTVAGRSHPPTVPRSPSLRLGKGVGGWEQVEAPLTRSACAIPSPAHAVRYYNRPAPRTPCATTSGPAHAVRYYNCPASGRCPRQGRGRVFLRGGGRLTVGRARA